MKRLVSLFLLSGAACGFNAGDGATPTPDGPPGPGPDERDLVLDSAADLASGAVLTEAFVSGAGGTGGPGTVEPVAWLPGRLLAELDDVAGPYDGTWSSRPPLAQLVGRGLMAPPFLNNNPPPGASSAGFVSWFSGEIRLDADAQRVALLVSLNALAFLDILRSDGSVLAHCNDTDADCAVTPPAAGWYPIRIGWKRPNGAGNTFQLQWAAGLDPLGDLDAATRLRTMVHTSELSGSRVEGFDTPRSINFVANATSLDVVKPIDLVWSPQLFGFNMGSPAYRNVAQLRIPETGSYDLGLDANDGASYRLWLDGEWVSKTSAFDYISDATNPPLELITKTLTAGWHDVVLEGYDTRGTTGNIDFTIGKAAQARATPQLANTRPVLGVSPRIATGANLNSATLLAGTAVPRPMTVPDIGAVSPEAVAVDVALRLRPRQWNGLQVLVFPPGVTTGIPLPFDSSLLPNDQSGDIQGSLTKSALGKVNAQGEWRVDVIHANVGGLNGGNVISAVRINVVYAGGPGLSMPVVPTSAGYSRMISLDAVHELHGLFLEAIKPAGSDVVATVQLCSDAAGASCEAALTPTQLADNKPKAQFVKVLAAFTSDGFAVPILDKLTLRYAE